MMTSVTVKRKYKITNEAIMVAGDRKLHLSEIPNACRCMARRCRVSLKMTNFCSTKNEDVNIGLH
jgi:hypothetical protein